MEPEQKCYCESKLKYKECCMKSIEQKFLENQPSCKICGNKINKLLKFKNIYFCELCYINQEKNVKRLILSSM